MAALPSTAADELLEGEILTAANEEERADRRMAIATVEQHAADDLDARAERDRIRGEPLGIVESRDDVLFGPDQADIDRVPGYSLGGVGDHRHARKPALVLIVAPQARIQ